MARTRPPAKTPEERENQLIAAAYDLAEKQILAGTASSQVISIFLKRGSEKERLECEILKSQRKLYDAKTDNLESTKRIDELYEQAIAALSRYNGDIYDKQED